MTASILPLTEHVFQKYEYTGKGDGVSEFPALVLCTASDF